MFFEPDNAFSIRSVFVFFPNLNTMRFQKKKRKKRKEILEWLAQQRIMIIRWHPDVYVQNTEGRLKFSSFKF